jgi:DNA-binding MarR family transcriptional regulator
METKDRNISLAEGLIQTIMDFSRLNVQKHSLGGLNRSEFYFLATLFNLSETGLVGVKASEISRTLEITPAAVTHILNTMEKKGLVERIADPTDRRCVLIRSTQAGQQIMELAHAILFEELKGLVGFLGEKNSEDLVRILALTRTYFKKHAAAQPDEDLTTS